jgi:hypothetical protein
VTSSDLFEAVERIADRGGEATDVLQAVVATIVERGGATWAAVFFYDEGELIVGPHAGAAEPGERREAPIVLDGAHVAQLAVDGLDDQALIDRVAVLIARYCTSPESLT